MQDSLDIKERQRNILFHPEPIIRAIAAASKHDIFIIVHKAWLAHQNRPDDLRLAVKFRKTLRAAKLIPVIGGLLCNISLIELRFMREQILPATGELLFHLFW